MKQRAKARATAAPAAQISAPAYHEYRADSLVAVDWTTLIERPIPAAYQPERAGPNFSEALGGLAGFDLQAEKPVAEALLAYYAEADSFIWVDGDRPNARAAEAMRVLSEAETFGLSSADYAMPMPATHGAAGDAAARAAALIRFEMALSARVLRYLRDARLGRVDPNRISGYYDFETKPFDGRAELARLLRARNTRAALEGAHPRNPEFRALLVELEALEGSVAGRDVTVDPELLLKPGQSSPELPNFLKLARPHLTDPEHVAAVDRFASGESYDEALVPAVKAVQELKGLRPDGVIGPRTVQALAGVSHADKLEKVRVALEQLRWMPRELGPTRVFINQPAFTAAYWENGSEQLEMRVVIGTPATQTSFFHDEIERVEFNPYWGVPQSILVNEMLPRLRRDPGYLDRAGYEVTDSKGRRIPSSAVNWGAYGAKIPFSVRQTPSEDNALGELKILFPNKHAIYMHDTPAKKLFERDMRAFSHGCVRLHDPRAMAAAVLGKSVDHVAGRIAEGHGSEKVTRHIPVYVAYFTAWPDASGTVEYFADVYERDARLRSAFEAVDEVRTPSS